MAKYVRQNWLPGQELFAFRGSKILCGTVYKTVFEQFQNGDIRVEYHLEDEDERDLGYILEHYLVESKEDAIKQYQAKMEGGEFIPEIEQEKIEVMFKNNNKAYHLLDTGEIKYVKIKRTKVTMDNSQEGLIKLVEYETEQDYGNLWSDDGFFKTKEQAVKHFVKCLEKTPVNTTIEL